MSARIAIPEIPPALDFPDIKKPYVELVDGRLVPKMSPKRLHGKLQLEIGSQIKEWGRGRGETGTEWRFYLLEEGEKRSSSLVPDVAYVSFERLPLHWPEDARERPRIAPDIAVEILSPGDRRRILERKIALYLQHGARVVIVVDPKRRTLALHRSEGVSMHDAHGLLPIEPFAGLVLDLDALFAGPALS